MNVMQYLLQMSDEFRDSYAEIDKRVTQILDKLEVLELRIRDLELRVNTNRNQYDDEYNKR